MTIVFETIDIRYLVLVAELHVSSIKYVLHDRSLKAGRYMFVN